jgi:glycosyltransferase involved in cell wall biosynthesis
MKILFLASGDRVPSTRYRILPIARHLRKAGFECRVRCGFPQKYQHLRWLGYRLSHVLKRITRAVHLIEAAFIRFDCIVIERELFDDNSILLERIFRKLSPAIMLDIDDAVFLRFPEKFEKLLTIPDVVIAGNPALQKQLAQHHSRVVGIPTCVDLDDYTFRDFSTAADPPIIGWIGINSNLEYLGLVLPILRRLAESRPFEFRIITTGPSAPQLDLSGIPTRILEWDPQTAAAELQWFDIGLMPLPDIPWTRFKCGLKLLEYMATGAVAVASPVGVNGDIISHGENGFLPRNDTEWESILSTLLDDAALRHRIALAGRAMVERRYSIAGNLDRFIEALKLAAPEAFSQ